MAHVTTVFGGVDVEHDVCVNILGDAFEYGVHGHGRGFAARPWGPSAAWVPECDRILSLAFANRVKRQSLARVLAADEFS